MQIVKYIILFSIFSPFSTSKNVTTSTNLTESINSTTISNSSNKPKKIYTLPKDQIRKIVSANIINKLKDIYAISTRSRIG